MKLGWVDREMKPPQETDARREGEQQKPRHNDSYVYSDHTKNEWMGRVAECDMYFIVCSMMSAKQTKTDEGMVPGLENT